MGPFNLFQSNNTEFCKAKQSNQAAAEREKVLSELAAGYDMYMELKSNLMEGTKVRSVGETIWCDGGGGGSQDSSWF